MRALVVGSIVAAAATIFYLVTVNVPALEGQAEHSAYVANYLRQALREDTQYVLAGTALVTGAPSFFSVNAEELAGLKEKVSQGEKELAELQCWRNENEFSRFSCEGREQRLREEVHKVRGLIASRWDQAQIKGFLAQADGAAAAVDSKRTSSTVVGAILAAISILLGGIAFTRRTPVIGDRVLRTPADALVADHSTTTKFAWIFGFMMAAFAVGSLAFQGKADRSPMVPIVVGVLLAASALVMFVLAVMLSSAKARARREDPELVAATRLRAWQITSDWSTSAAQSAIKTRKKRAEDLRAAGEQARLEEALAEVARLEAEAEAPPPDFETQVKAKTEGLAAARARIAALLKVQGDADSIKKVEEEVAGLRAELGGLAETIKKATPEMG